MGFGNKWCKWIKSCLKSASMSVLVNGSPTEEFGFERGVRQGDPLSPFIFLLVAEGLNAIVSEAVSKGIFKGIEVGSNRVVVSHLQYAYDIIFFGEWHKENVSALLCILKCFEEVSGLRVNFNKNNLYGVGADSNEAEEMARWMRCSVGEFLFTYLGLPIGECMSRSSAWRDLWRWSFHESDSFKVRVLTKMVEEKTLCMGSDSQETIWIKLMPKENIGNVNAFSIRDLFVSCGNVVIPIHSRLLWHAVIWSTRIFIWKERNNRVFKGKIPSVNKIVQEIQLKSFDWIVRRSIKSLLIGNSGCLSRRNVSWRLDCSMGLQFTC
uniref:Putative ribonuclease H protein At1g65750 family n=1 Tax=Tanacetum cinerariifolium TaxID=118510 RepID=A0A699J6J6_TANCI|nr:putative ribonuclease H protein At1g65750 family [Tanacetum cinerariifolium]